MSYDPVLCVGEMWEKARANLEAVLGPLSEQDIEYVENFLHLLGRASLSQQIASISPTPERITGLSVLLLKFSDADSLARVIISFFALLIGIDAIRNDPPGEVAGDILKALDIGAQKLGHEKGADLLYKLAPKVTLQ